MGDCCAMPSWLPEGTEWIPPYTFATHRANSFIYVHHLIIPWLLTGPWTYVLTSLKNTVAEMMSGSIKNKSVCSVRPLMADLHMQVITWCHRYHMMTKRSSLQWYVCESSQEVHLGKGYFQRHMSATWLRSSAPHMSCSACWYSTWTESTLYWSCA